MYVLYVFNHYNYVSDQHYYKDYSSYMMHLNVENNEKLYKPALGDLY